MAQPLIKQACDMVHREQFTASLASLGLIATGADHSDKSQPTTSTGALPKCSNQTQQKPKYVQVSKTFDLLLEVFNDLLIITSLIILQFFRQIIFLRFCISLSYPILKGVNTSH